MHIPFLLFGTQTNHPGPTTSGFDHRFDQNQK